MIAHIANVIDKTGSDCLLPLINMHGSRGGTGGPDTLKNHKNMEFLSNTGPDPLTKASIPCWAIISKPTKHHMMFRWQADDQAHL